MPKISDLRQTIRDPNRVSVYIDGKYAFACPISFVSEHKLRVGADLSTDDIALLTAEAITATGYIAFLAWMMNRPRSPREQRRYAQRKKIPHHTLSSWQTKAAAHGLGDQRQYAAWFVRRGSEVHHRSRRAISTMLRAEGVASDIISETIPPEEAEEKTIDVLIQKQLRMSRYRQDPHKLIGFLLRRGYQYADIRAAFTRQSLQWPGLPVSDD